MVAASDHPTEYQIKRNEIAENLFSCGLINSSECDMLKSPSSNASCLTDDDAKNVAKVLRMINDVLRKSGDEFQSELVVVPKDHGGGVYSQGVAEVLRMKKILEKSEPESVVCDLLTKLQDMGLSFKTLEATMIGKSVRPFRKHASENVRQIAVALINAWKRTVDEWMQNQSSDDVEPTSLPTNVDVNSEKKVKGSEKDAKSGQGIMDSEKPEATKRKPTNLEKKSKGSEKAAKGLMMDSEKLEATKRKLQEGYEKVEKIKRQRRIQVIEVHEVTKQGLLPREKPARVNNYTRKGYGRCR